MTLFGLELELFFKKDGNIGPPPASADIPVDGFAGLVELRSVVSGDIYECYGHLMAKKRKIEDIYGCELLLSPAHKFSAAERSLIRKNKFAPAKNRDVDIRNIYGKGLRQLPTGWAQASVQVNVSKRLSSSYTTKDGSTVPERFGLLDTLAVVSALDKEFSKEIKDAKRAAGWYAIKEFVRLEYRSLPNSAFDIYFPSRVLKALHT